MADSIKIASERKHHKVTLKVKYEALKELEKGRPNKDVANQFSIPGSTLATWKNNKEKIFEAFQNSSLKRQRVKAWIYKKLNEALLKWFTSMRGSNIPISGPILLEKAHEFAKAFNYNDFTTSNGWLLKRMLFLSLYNTLHREETSPAYFFSKFGRNNLNSYNSKTHVIRTNFESPWGFELYEFNCIWNYWIITN